MRALPAADFDALLVLPSRKTFDAALAAFFEVTLLGAFVWDKALPAAVLDLEPVDLLRSVFDALLAAFGLVTLDFAIFLFSYFFLGLREGATKNKIIKLSACKDYLLLHSLHCSFEGRVLVFFQPGEG